MNEVKVPLWIVVGLFGAFLSVGGWSAQAVLELRDRSTRIEGRVAAIESRPAPVNPSTELATMAEQIKNLTKSVDELRDDIRGNRRPAPK